MVAQSVLLAVLSNMCIGFVLGVHTFACPPSAVTKLPSAALGHRVTNVQELVGSAPDHLITVTTNCGNHMNN